MAVEVHQESVPAATGQALVPASLKIENLKVWSGSTEILKGISLEASKGEILSIIGPAGAGKTTFLRCCNRLVDLEPAIEISGRVLLEGVSIYEDDVERAWVRRRVGMVFSVPVPLPMTIYQNLTFGLALARVSQNSFGEKIEQALRGAYLWDEVKDRLKEPAGNLSGGQQQRLCLARTLILRPKVLLLDEPCSGLDPISTAKIEEALQRIKAELAIVLVTNNVKQGARASDRTAFFLFGELVEVGPTSKQFTNPKDPRTLEYISGRFG